MEISRRPRHAGPSTAEIIQRDPAEDEPRRSEGFSERTADFRFPDAWMIAHRNLDDAETLDRPPENQFNGPTVRCFFQFDRAQDFGAGGAERTKVADLDSVEVRNQAGREPIAEAGMPGKRPVRARACES